MRNGGRAARSVVIGNVGTAASRRGWRGRRGRIAILVATPRGLVFRREQTGAFPSVKTVFPIDPAQTAISSMNASGRQPGDRLMLLGFRLDRGRHALALDAVERAIRAAAVTPLPGMPAPMLGILDLEGELLPVLSVRRRLGMDQPPLSPDHHFLVARMASRRVLLVVDAVESLFERSWARPPGDLGYRGLRGIVQLEDGLVLIHDLEAFFAPEEWRAVDRAIDSARAPA
jgi:purine-binding chemotaxis protein CheW